MTIVQRQYKDDADDADADADADADTAAADDDEIQDIKHGHLAPSVGPFLHLQVFVL